MFQSIRLRLILSYVLLTVLTIGVLGILSLYFLRTYAERQEKEYLQITAKNIAAQVKMHLPRQVPFQDVAQASAQKRALLVLKEIADTAGFLGNVRVRIRDDKKEVIVESAFKQRSTLWFYRAPMVWGEADSTPITVERRDHRIGPVFMFRSVDGEENIITAKRMPPPKPSISSQTIIHSIIENNSPLGFVELSNGPDYSSQIIITARNAFLLAALGATAVSILVGLFMGRRMTSPLLSLSSAAIAMGQQRWHVRAPDCGNDEIGQVAKQFNLMADRLEKSFQTISRERDTLKRFVQDASHELRTPITALSTFNQLLLGQPVADPASRQECIRESQQQINKLAWIVQNLLDLSRLDAGITPLDIAGNDVPELVRESWNSVRNCADGKQIKFTSNFEDSLPKLFCDKDLVEMALRNVLNNAIKFAPRESTVEVGIETEDEEIFLWVADQGPGIDQKDLPHIFDRFYRGHNNTSHGSGLGLSIVKSIVDAHGGTISVESRYREGSKFLFRFPMRQI